MIGSVSSSFSDLVIIGEIIEGGLKSGKIQGASSTQVGAKKFSNDGPKKKEGDTNTIMGHHMSYYPYPYVEAVAPR